MGQWGDPCGDVIFAWEHGYVSGCYSQWRGFVGGGSVGAPPTICHLLGIEPPAQSQGSVARDIFEGDEMVRERPK